MAFKNLVSPTKNVNDYTATKTVPMVPGKRDPAINEKRADVVPASSPAIPWPAAHPVDGNPMKGIK